MRSVLLASIIEESRSGFWGSEAGSGDVDVRVVRNGDIQDYGVRWGALPLRAVSKAEADRAAVREGDILITTSGNCGYVAHVAETPIEPTIASNFVRILRFNHDKVVPRFIFHFVHSSNFRLRLSPYIRGTTLKNLALPAAAGRIEVPLPDVAAQRRIAEILDKADALRAKRRAALAELDTLTQSIFHDMFGDPIVNDRQFPTRPMIDLVDGARPISYGILMPGPDQPEGVKYVRVVDMQDGGIALSGIRKTTEAMSNAFRRSLLKPGDLLMSIRGHVGRMAVVPPELDGANITQDTARLAITGADPVFVRECLRTQGFQRWMAKHTKGVAVRGINLGDVKLMPVITPDLSEQQRFAQLALAADALKAAASAGLAKLDALCASLHDRAFRGDL